MQSLQCLQYKCKLQRLHFFIFDVFFCLELYGLQIELNRQIVWWRVTESVTEICLVIQNSVTLYRSFTMQKMQRL